MWHRIFKRDAAPDALPAKDNRELPFDVATCLESASIHQRSSSDEGVRAVVQIGNIGWIHTPDESRAQLLRLWPGLNDAQLKRAVRYLGAKVRRTTVPPEPERRSWALNW